MFAAVVALGCACGGAKATVSARAAALSTPPATGGTIELSRMRMVIDRVRLTPVASSQGSSYSGGSGSEDDEVGTGPYLLDFAAADLSGGATEHAFDIAAPPGDYRALKIRTHVLDGNEQAAAGAAFTEMAGKSITIEGTFDGNAFSFSSTLDEDQEREAALTIDGSGSSNITLAFDTAAWFNDGANGALDPRAATNRSRIENNIKSSIKAFEDDDHDGHEDSH